jgi:acetyl esterase/lipase
MNHLAARGWVCVAANYRLSPKATFPDHLVDLKMAIAWIRSNIAEFGGDPDFICVTGGSAGGHLTAMLGLTAGDPAYQPGFEEVDTSVAAAVPFYGIYDFANSRHVHGNDGMDRFVEHVILKVAQDEDPDLWRRSSPIFRVRPDAPPFLVIHGTHDTLAPVGEAREFVAALREVSENPVAYAELEGAQHAFEVFHSPRTAHVVNGVAEFLSWVHGRYLKERRLREAQPSMAAAASPERTAPSTQG